MKIELFLISSFEEYPNKHVCRKHWNYQWRSRRRYSLNENNKKIKLRKEPFGGLLKNFDGKLYKLDDMGYKALELYFQDKTPEDIIKKLDLKPEIANNFFSEINHLGISL